MLRLYIECFTKRFFEFNRRAGRKEYLSFLLFTNAVEIIISLMFFLDIDELMISLLGLVYLVISIIPIISVTIRRFHDLNLSGWWSILIVIGGLLISIVPSRNMPLSLCIMIIAVTLIIAFKKGTPGPNKYGEPPVY